MPPRLHVPVALAPGVVLALPPGAARHVQVLRLQPGEAVTLFNGEGGEWSATVERMGRSDVDVRVERHAAIDRELRLRVTLAFGMPANERMDGLVEKATELGVALIQPLVCERSVLRLHGERAEKKRLHWQSVAAGASEQCGRTRVPSVASVIALNDWLSTFGPAPAQTERCVLSLRPMASAAGRVASVGAVGDYLFLSGPEGGLTDSEERTAIDRSFKPMTLGARVLRADTAPIAVLALLALSAEA